MRYGQVKVITTVTAINIDNGLAEHIRPDIYDIEPLSHRPTDCPDPYNYYLIKGTRFGAVIRWWEDREKAGEVELVRIAESTDITLDGIMLPIRSSSQLTEHQKTSLVCGHLVKGRFLCERCTLAYGLSYPHAIAVYPCNILPYSQDCEECKIQIFEIWKSKSGGPLNLFRSM